MNSKVQKMHNANLKGGGMSQDKLKLKVSYVGEGVITRLDDDLQELLDARGFDLISAGYDFNTQVREMNFEK